MDLEAIAVGEASIPACDRDWVTWSGIIAKVIRHLGGSSAPAAGAGSIDVGPALEPARQEWEKQYTERFSTVPRQDEHHAFAEGFKAGLRATPAPVSAAPLTDEQYQEILRPILSRKGMQYYLNGDAITLDPSDYRAIIDRARASLPPSAGAPETAVVQRIRDMCNGATGNQIRAALDGMLSAGAPVSAAEQERIQDMRKLAEVIPGRNPDGVHLSPAGRERAAQVIASAAQPARQQEAEQASCKVCNGTRAIAGPIGDPPSECDACSDQSPADGQELPALPKPWRERVKLDALHDSYRTSESLRAAEAEIADWRALTMQRLDDLPRPLRVVRRSDMSVEVGFRSCAEASRFERAIAAKQAGKEGS
ncbi:hypothetical protein IP92_04902 [Pseudoduganella flava]|nr:hypothetical protein IP92_04902 [Pseudoduganella flava]